MDQVLMHYGMPRRSGRYPWGSGDDPYQHGGSKATYNSRFMQMYKDGASMEVIAKTLGKPKNDIQWYELVRHVDIPDKEIYKAFGISSREFRNHFSNGKNAKRAEDVKQVLWYKSEAGGYKSNMEISRIMDIPEATVRNYLNQKIAANNAKTQKAADEIKEFLEKHKYVDVGTGTELTLGITADRLEKAIGLLEQEGYKRHQVKVDQLGTNYQTTYKVLTKGDVEWREVLEHRNDISFMKSQYVLDEDGTIHPNEPIQNIDSKRIQVRYAEDGGKEQDGLIELRRGTKDLDLGDAKYAQVRIGVDGTHYLKGMAVYSDDLPPGIDIRFNTNKHVGTPLSKVLKEQKGDDPSNPFGASLKEEDQLKLVQRYYTDDNGQKRLSPINVVNEQGAWERWSRNLPSQFLSKQPVSLAKEQLKWARLERESEFDEIMSLTNNTVKRQRLEDFAEGCDAAAVSLKAHAMPHQSTHVLIPVPSIRDGEIFAPNFKDGTSVILVRFPHGGQFEIPRLTVNNNNKDAIERIGIHSVDAVGINAKAAEQLSGADFDGDTALVIPDNMGRIKTQQLLKDLEGFDAKEQYGDAPEGCYIKKKGSIQEQREMGMITNLITDMTPGNAPTDELARAVRHSMVVIDSAKHHLNIKQSAEDNRIQELKDKWQPKEDPTKPGGGAATIISRAKSEIRVNERIKSYGINPTNTDPETGKRIIREKAPFKYDEKTGEPVYKTQSIKMMEYVDDANDLISVHRYPIEQVYADYANSMKALANQARKAFMDTPRSKYSRSAAEEYKEEVESLNMKLKRALSNAPREREAQIVGHQLYDARVAAAAEPDKEHKKKIRNKALLDARKIVGAHKDKVDITDREWEAIQAGAISDSSLSRILKNADPDRVKKLATPRGDTSISPAKQALIKALAARGTDGTDGYTLAEIADQVGVSPTTVGKYLSGTIE